MNPNLRHWSRVALVVLLLGALAIPATGYRQGFFQEGKRSWWYFDGNDACQAVAAHALSQRLGGPNDYVIWPGVTLNTTYLYGHLLSPRPARGDIQAMVTSLGEAVFWHWRAAFLQQILAVWIFFGVLWLACRNLSWSFAGALGMALHPWYAWETNNIRPESLSMVFLGVATGIFLAGRPRWLWPAGLPLGVGVLLGLAVLTKIQTLPLVALMAVMVCAARSPIAALSLTARPAPAIVSGSGILRFCSTLCVIFSPAFLKTPMIQGASYQLPGKAAWPGYLATAVVMGIAFFSHKTSLPPRVVVLLRVLLVLLAGFFLSLIALTIPNLWFGGWKAWLFSVNRICFAIVSYPFSGLKWKSMDGWGDGGGWQERMGAIQGLWEQSPGTLPLVLVFLLLSIPLFFFRKKREGDKSTRQKPGKEVSWLTHPLAPWVVLLAGLFMDLSSSQRVVGGSIYSFYSLYSYPLYVGALVMLVVYGWGRLAPRAASWAGVAAASALLLFVPEAVKRAESKFLWLLPEERPEAYRENLDIIRIVAPNFENLAGVSVDEIFSQISRVDGNP